MRSIKTYYKVMQYLYRYNIACNVDVFIAIEPHSQWYDGGLAIRLTTNITESPLKYFYSGLNLHDTYIKSSFEFIGSAPNEELYFKYSENDNFELCMHPDTNEYWYEMDKVFPLSKILGITFKEHIDWINNA